MEIRQSSFNFPEATGGEQSASQDISFSRDVLRVAVGMTGYSALFESDDHHLGRLGAKLSASIDGDDPKLVHVSGGFTLRDWSGEFDDPFRGNIQWVLLADLVAAPTPGPGEARSDLIIVDAEIIQVIQHFRSAQHLDAANVFPDNSIRLVADKPTAVRLYVEYDASSGLPLIGTLNGDLNVMSEGTTTTLAPLQTIVPRRDASLERGIRSHTMNFIIPENLCRGTVGLRAQVRDNFNSTQFSRDFEREILFENMPELPVMAVGIDYTGDDIRDDAADDELTVPEESDFVAVFRFTEQVYPIPAVVITNYQTMTYDKDIKSDISEGCDKFGDLKDAVADLRGDSDDIVYGLLNTGVDVGSVGGCGGDGVAVGIVGRQGTAAHETGHALGRQHAPCDNVTRCAEPQNQDGDYPVYSGYDSDSIGEYGFDTRGMFGAVKDPAIAHDFMGYSPNDWISPYTYKALMSRIPTEFGGGAGQAGASLLRAAPGQSKRPNDGEWIRMKTPQLFLRMDIPRDRKVRFHTAFHFDARPRPHGPNATDFSVELLGDHGNVLRSACLYAATTCCGCDCGGSRWPVRIRQAVAFDPKARRLALYEKDKLIGEWAIPDPPKVTIDCSGADNAEADALRVYWDVPAPEGEGYGELWFLVQWRDAAGTWRGCAPRMRERELVVPKRLFGRQQRFAIRVLASSGIATGIAVCEGDLRVPAPPGPGQPPVEVGLAGVPPRGTETVDLPPVVRAVARSPQAGMLSKPEIRWYDERGGEIGRGVSFDLRNLSRGQTLLTATVLDRGQGSGHAQWLIDRTSSDTFHILRGSAPGKRPKYNDR